MIKCKLEEKIVIDSKKISNKLDFFLEKKLKKKIGNRCIKEGYVFENSIKIFSKSTGFINYGHLNNYIHYNLSYVADVFNPGIGIIIPNCTIEKKTKMGLIVQGDKDTPINILIASQHNTENKIFKNYKEKDKITVELIGKKFDVNSKYIFGIGKIVEDHHISSDESDSDDSESSDNENFEIVESNIESDNDSDSNSESESGDKSSESNDSNNDSNNESNNDSDNDSDNESNIESNIESNSE